jgi:hypothetical protein
LAIWNVHPYAHSIINQLADRGGADLGNPPEKRLKPIHVQAGGLLAYGLDMAWDGLFELLWNVITAPVSFLRCDLCKSVFVPASHKILFPGMRLP